MTSFDLSSIPDMLNTVLFAGTNETAAELLLSFFLIFTCALPMMVTKQRPEIFLAIIALVVLVETAIGWLDEFGAIVLILIVAAMLGKMLSRYAAG
jgi:hypothetical protein